MIVAVKRGLEEKGGRARGYKGGCNHHPNDDNFFLFSFHPVSFVGEGVRHFYLFPSVLFSSLGSCPLSSPDLSGLFFSPPCFLDLRFFFFAPPNLWLVDLLREFFVINMDEGIFFYFISTQEIVVEVI